MLFVGTRDGHERAVVKAADMAGGCHLFDRWIPGSITNGPQILGRCGVKVVDETDKEIHGFEEQLEAHGALKPDLVVCLNPTENYVLLHECGLNNIPTIGVIDTDANPTWVTYPIPANDDRYAATDCSLFYLSNTDRCSQRCIQVIAGVLGRAGEEGQAARLSQAARGRVTYSATHGLVAPTSEGLGRDTDLSFNPNIADPDADVHRNVTSSTNLQDDPIVDSNAEVSLMAAFEYAKFADFDDDAIQAAIDMFQVEHGSESPELAELTRKLREARQAHGIEETDGGVFDTEVIDEETAQALEENVREMMDEPVTTEEAAALHAQDGGVGKNVYEGSSYRTALERKKDAEDPILRRMIALKRRQFGEELSAADSEELKKHDEEQNKVASVDQASSSSA